MKNKTARVVEYRGRQWRLGKLAKHLGMSYVTLYTRIFKMGWSVRQATNEIDREREEASQIAFKQALSHPDNPPPQIGDGTPKTAMVGFGGRLVSVADLASVHGMPARRLYNRIFELGWSVERALTDTIPLRQLLR